MKIKNIPINIYLQLTGDDSSDSVQGREHIKECDHDFNKLHKKTGVSWTQDKLNESDLEYVSRDFIEELFVDLKMGIRKEWPQDKNYFIMILEAIEDKILNYKL